MDGEYNAVVETKVNRESMMASLIASDLAEDVYNQASQEIFLETIKDLTALGPRPYNSPTNDIARSWLISKLNNVSNNKLEIEVSEYTDSIVARLPGTLNNSMGYVIGGHYDTVESSPGANDDGTGVVTTIELARILSQYEWPLDIYFCLWNAEELGLVGAGEIAGQFFSNEIDILCLYNIDMLLVQRDLAPSDERILLYYTADYISSTRNTHYTIYQDSQYWAELIHTMNFNYGTPKIKIYPHTSSDSWFYSDHYRFYTQGYKSAMFFFESGFGYDTAYHTSQDTWDNSLYDYSLTVPVVASIGASIAHAQCRTVGQKFIDRFSLILGPDSRKEIRFPSTLATEVNLSATTSNGNALQFEALNPLRFVLDSNAPDTSNLVHETVLSFTSEKQGEHAIVVKNLESVAVEVEIELEYDSDFEGDSIPDSSQDWYNRFETDSDLDTLTDMEEMKLGINRFSADTDSDTIPDNEEIRIYGTLPYAKDSDGDAMPDPWEIFYELDPTDRDDKLEDPDEDLLNNIGEYRAGTNPRLNDSDFDSILDGLEVLKYHTSPLSNDTDLDSLPDSWEIEYGLNPLVDDANEDPDQDGKTNLEEYLLGEDPNVNTELSTQTSTSETSDLSIVILGTGAIITAVILISLRQRRINH